MKRRLYFLLPDTARTRAVVSELETNGIERRRMHVIAAPGIDLQDLPTASPNQRKDLGAQLETIIWDGNLALFFIALLALTILALLAVSWFWLLLPLAAMLATFIAGAEFSKRIPNAHLHEFTDAIHHGEILLMVDTPTRQVAHVESLVQRHHPDAIAGGVGWHVDALHI